MQITAALQGRRVGTTDRRKGRSGVFAAFALMALLALFVPTVHAQIKNGGFEAQSFSEWKLERYTRSSNALTTVPPTNSSQLTLGAVQETHPSTNTLNTAFGGNLRILTTAGVAANTGGNGARYPFSGAASSQLGGDGARAAYAMEQEATMVLSDVDPVDGKVHLRFAMAPVLNNPNHPAGQQPFFFVEVINLTKGDTQLFHTFNYSNQPGIPWQQYSMGSNNYQFTNWQGFDISPGNGRLDVGDQIRLKVYVANCSAGAANHTAQVYMDVFGSKMPGLSVAAVGPSTTKPGQQVTYTYNYVNNSGVYALGSTVRLAAPFTENGLPLTFVPGSWPATCTGPFTGTAPRGDYIECPVGDLVAGAGGSFPVTFTVPAGAATTGPNNVINNGDYDVRANTVSPFIGPLVKATISPAATTLLDLGVSVSNGSVPSYLVGGAVAYTVTVTNNGPVDANGVTLSQTLSGATGTAGWTCSVPGGSAASCGATSSGSGPIATATASLPVGQSLVYTVTGITATAAGTPVVTVVSVAPPAGMSDSVSANNTDGISTPVSAAQHLLTANTIGAGTGRINAIPAVYACPSGGARTACSSENLGEGQEAYLTAVAANGSIFKGWTGGCTTVTGNECHVRMGTQDLQVTAEFATVWMVTPSITGGTLNTTSPQVVEDGQGTSFTLTPTTAGDVPVITTPGGANTCQATLSGPTAGAYTYSVTPVTQDCAFHVAFVSQPRLVIAKTASIVAPASASVGVPFSYTITVSNTGAAATTATATVTDVVPAGLTIGALPANCATNPSGSQTVECTIAAGLSNVSPGNAVSFVIPVTPQASVNSTTVSNTASVTGGGDPACASAGSCVSAPVDTAITASSLDIVKTGPPSAVVGVPYDYTVTVTNTGTGATSAAATVTDLVPAGLTIGTLPAGCATNPSGSQTVVCTIAAGLSHTAPGNVASYAIRVTPTVAAGASVGNTASVTGGGDPDCAAGCSSQTVTTTISAPALGITKHGPAAAVVGVPFDYTIVVSNSGTADATANAIVTDTVPANVAVNNATPNCAIAGRDVTCTVAMADLQIGEQATITINVTPATAGSASNTATVTGGGDPGCSVGCTSTPVTTDVLAQAPVLQIAKSVSSTGPYGVGSVIAYQFAVTNTGNVALTGIVVNDAQLDAPAVCPSTTLQPGASTTCTGAHTVTAVEVAAGNVHNSATVSGQPPTPPGGPMPPVVTSLPGEVDTATEQLPAMTVVKSVTSTGPYNTGSVLAYQFLVTNTGNVILTGVVVNDALLDAPATCAATTLAPGANTTCSGVHTVTAAEVAVGNVHNSATVSGQPPTPPGGPTPPTITSPPSSVDTATEQVPAMTLVKSVTSTGPYRAGSTITYQFDVENTGNVTLTNVSVTDAMAGLSALTYAWPGVAGQLQPGEKVVANATYSVTPDDVLDGQVRNSATAAGQPPTPPGGTQPPGVSTPSSSVDTAILPVVNAVDDALAAVDGASGNPSAGNAYGNDVINGAAVDPSRIAGTVTTPATSINGGPVPVLDPASGVVSVPAGTPAGVYTIGYRICESLNPDNCDDAVVTLTVVATAINAEQDAFVPIRSGTGGTSPSVLGNDTLGGGPALIGQVTLVPGSSPRAGLVMNPDGTVTIAVGTPPGTYRYSYTLCEVLNPTNCDTADAIVVVSGEAQLRVTKTAGVRDAQTGDLVRYTVSVENLGDGPLVNGSIIDTPAAGFSYVEGSLAVTDGDNAATVSGQHPVRFEGLDIAVGGSARLAYMMRVGAGARAGTQVNQAQAVSSSGEVLSNVATAEVTLVANAMVEDSLIFGTVFNDRDGDGWQDSAVLSGIRVQGGFAAGAYVAGSTTLDRGAGPQPQPDASAPLLHGIDLGQVEGRQSRADPLHGRQVVIRQTLRELSFTDDFVLTNDQGVTLRMDRNGTTSVVTTAQAAKGLTAAMPTVERRVAQGSDGYVVDYIIGNAGIDERGVPGVRIATVEGVLIETDQFGRYHLVGVSGGAWARGRNLIMKVDPSTLPAGTRMTTDNPLLRRVTPGVPVRFDWGVTLPEQAIGGGSGQLELELGEVHFAPGSAQLPPRYAPLMTAMASKVREHQGGEVVIQADGEYEALAFDRANAVKDALLAQLDGPAAKALVVSVRARPEAPASLLTGVRGDAALLGTVLFDTDQATIRAEFVPLLDTIAAAIERSGGGNVAIVGHADRRGSHAYNTELGMRRAKSVFDALATRLGASARSALRVEIESDPIAPQGARK
ncbi:putative repeat protein (TIGR01451 family) [Pseudoxanthomonas japonensis]|uniref:DUF7507 domain-containing protein n=1 Tax=Pseudoxanthomonas japonensis TaxID=69284 RepID=UPI002864CCC0|nr:OmpA family protein [Pseudoxanthomonas japonensis]MDR7067351.1 putative repeat protein (TIGR01451 family) [Pseudoxanthomonas japonensis]